MRNSFNGRFIVWDLLTDPFDHTQLALNLDRIDRMIGGPGGSPGVHDTSNPPRPKGTPSTWLSLGDIANDPFNRTLYDIISGLNFNDVPLGSIIMWDRPHVGVDLPNGWVPCDGSTYTNDTTVSPPVILHSYPETSVTVRDFRNAFPLGAYDTDTAVHTTAGGNPSLRRGNVVAGATDASTDGPGIGYSSRSGNAAKIIGSGSNVPRNLSHIHDGGSLQVPFHTHRFSHVHSLGGHTHNIENHLHLIPDHNHTFYHTHSIPAHNHTISHQHNVAYPERNMYWGSTTPPSAINTSFVAGVDAALSFWSGYPMSVNDTPRNGFGAWRQAYRVDAPSAGHTHSVAVHNSVAEAADPYTRMVTDGPSSGFSGVQATYATGAPDSANGWVTDGVLSFSAVNRTTGGMYWDHSSPVASGAPSLSDTLDARTLNGSIASQYGNDHTEGPSGSSGTLLGDTGLPLKPPGVPPPGQTTFIDSSSVDIRPAYVGVLFIQKIKVADNLV